MAEAHASPALVEANAEANRLLKGSRPGEALAVLDTALKMEASPAAQSTLLANRGLCLEQLGRVDEAVEALQAAVAADASNASARDIKHQLEASRALSEALEAAERNEFERALALFTKAGALDPEGDGIWRYNTAVMLNKMGKYDDALRELERYEREVSAEEDPAWRVRCLPLYGELLCKVERWEKAARIIEEATTVEKLELPASLLYNYGVALLKCKQPDRSRRAFEDVIAAYPNYGLAYDAIASIDAMEGATLCQQGSFVSAIPKLAAASKRTPKPTTLYNLGLALLKVKRAREALDTFRALLDRDPENASAKNGVEAAEFMLQAGTAVEAPPADGGGGGDDDDGRATARVAPRKRIYQIAKEKGVGSFAHQDDMVQLLSGIEEWVESTLGPLERRVVALEAATDAAGGLVGSVSEDRTVLQLLFDRVASLEEQKAYSLGEDWADDGDSTVAGDDDASVISSSSRQRPPSLFPPPHIAHQLNAASSTQKLYSLTQTTDGLNSRLKSLERLLLGAGTDAARRPPSLGGGLLGPSDDDDDDDYAPQQQQQQQQQQRPSSDASTMSLVARLAVQEQRFAKMSTEFEQQQLAMERMQGQLDALLSQPPPPPEDGPRDPLASHYTPLRPSQGVNFAASHASPRPPSTPVFGARVGKLEGPNMMDELKSATARRASKRRELGLTLHD